MVSWENEKACPWTPTSVQTFYYGEKFVVKTNAGYFKVVAADMKLEQRIQRSTKGPRGIIGQTKHRTYFTEWELAYHEAWLWAKAMAKSWNQFWQIQLQTLCTNNWGTDLFMWTNFYIPWNHEKIMSFLLVSGGNIN